MVPRVAANDAASSLSSSSNNCIDHRMKSLLLGISYPCVTTQMAEHGFDPTILVHKEGSVEQAVECVRRGIFTEMDGRDLARCVATELAGDLDAYTVSKEVGANYKSDRHMHGNFNARNFCRSLKNAFGEDIQFDQVILDYYWMPTGWLVTRWAKTLFQQTLPDLVKSNMLRYPDSPDDRKDGMEIGVVYLPFCAHVCKELVGGIKTLKQYYEISFMKKDELPAHSLWKGTMTIDENVMQTRLGKRLDQEEIYCTFRPKDIMESMEDAHISKPEVMRILYAIEDYDNIRMIRLRPLLKHKPGYKPVPGVKPEVGGFIGLNFKRAKELKKTKALAAKRRRVSRTIVAEESDEEEEEEEPNPYLADTDYSDMEDELDYEAVCLAKPVIKTTYFYPRPATDLKTYNNPVDLQVHDKVWHQFISQFSCFRNSAQYKRRKTKASSRETIQLDQIGVPIDQVDTGKKKKRKTKRGEIEYLTHNPRVIEDADKREHDHWKPMKTEHELAVQLGACRDMKANAAFGLFSLKNSKLTSYGRDKLGERELTCYKIPDTEVMKKRSSYRMALMRQMQDREVEEDGQQPLSAFSAMRLAIKASRGQHHVLLTSQEQRVAIEEVKEEIRKQMNDDPSLPNRRIILETIIQWLVGGRSQEDDPRGVFALVDDLLPETDMTSLARNAEAIEEYYQLWSQYDTSTEPGKNDTQMPDLSLLSDLADRQLTKITATQAVERESQAAQDALSVTNAPSDTNENVEPVKKKRGRGRPRKSESSTGKGKSKVHSSQFLEKASSDVATVPAMEKQNPTVEKVEDVIQPSANQIEARQLFVAQLMIQKFSGDTSTTEKMPTSSQSKAPSERQKCSVLDLHDLVKAALQPSPPKKLPKKKSRGKRIESSAYKLLKRGPPDVTAGGGSGSGSTKKAASNGSTKKASTSKKLTTTKSPARAKGAKRTLELSPKSTQQRAKQKRLRKSPPEKLSSPKSQQSQTPCDVKSTFPTVMPMPNLGQPQRDFSERCPAFDEHWQRQQQESEYFQHLHAHQHGDARFQNLHPRQNDAGQFPSGHMPHHENRPFQNQLQPQNDDVQLQNRYPPQNEDQQFHYGYPQQHEDQQFQHHNLQRREDDHLQPHLQQQQLHHRQYADHERQPQHCRPPPCKRDIVRFMEWLLDEGNREPNPEMEMLCWLLPQSVHGHTAEEKAEAMEWCLQVLVNMFGPEWGSVVHRAQTTGPPDVRKKAHYQLMQAVCVSPSPPNSESEYWNPPPRHQQHMRYPARFEGAAAASVGASAIQSDDPVLINGRLMQSVDRGSDAEYYPQHHHYRHPRPPQTRQLFDPDASMRKFPHH